MNLPFFKEFNFEEPNIIKEIDILPEGEEDKE